MLLRTYLYNILRNRKRFYRILSLLLVASGLLWVNQIVTTKSPPGIYSHTTKVYSEWDVFEAPTLLKQIREHLTLPVDRSVPYNLTANGNGQIAPAGGQKFGFQSEGSVECYSLYSILKAAEAPNVVDLLVLDIEGGELEILRGYPFHLLPIKVIAVEYWITPGGSRALLKLLKENGYQLKYTGISDMIFVLE
ncbi:Protein Star [Orchesella cincta]|uniref:Protein Star n=1 Tax=Orchesella cincta TaxID=48709 RepID=A0A1D2MG07_ORCCI|nr:Protein Star [Orchesella cincta]